MFSTFTILLIGLLFGLKHATEVDHVVAVSTIASQQRNVLRSALVGALWGAGHTASLLIIGVVVLSLRIAIPASVSNWFEFGVALMIIALGAAGLWRHSARQKHSHAVSVIGIKPVLIGMMHGLAGSGALTLLVLTQISSVWLGLLYLAVFGFGSVVGMILMSGLIGLPFALTARNLASVHYRMQMVAAVVSIAFGLWYAYQTAF